MARPKKTVLTTEQQIAQVIKEIKSEKERMEECRENIKSLEIRQKELERNKRIEDGEKLLQAMESQGLKLDKAIEKMKGKAV